MLTFSDLAPGRACKQLPSAREPAAKRHVAPKATIDPVALPPLAESSEHVKDRISQCIRRPYPLLELLSCRHNVLQTPKPRALGPARQVTTTTPLLSADHALRCVLAPRSRADLMFPPRNAALPGRRPLTLRAGSPSRRHSSDHHALLSSRTAAAAAALIAPRNAQVLPTTTSLALLAAAQGPCKPRIRHSLHTLPTSRSPSLGHMHPTTPSHRLPTTTAG